MPNGICSTYVPSANGPLASPRLGWPSLGFISAVGIYMNKTSLAAYYSVQACEFASSQACLEIYAGLYAEGLGST